MSISHKASNLALHNRVCSVPEGGILFPFDSGLHGVDSAGNIIQPLGGAVATLRPGEGKFGGAVAVEEGTMNLLGYPLEQEYYGGNLRGLTNGAWETDGDKIICHSRPNSAYPGWKINVSSGETVTFSGRVPEIFYGAFYLYERGFDANNQTVFSQRYRNLRTARFDEDGHFEYTVTYSEPSLSYVNVGIGWNVDVGSSYWMEKIQAEKKPFATSFVDGTRANGTLLYYDEPNSGDDYTIALWAKTHTNDPSTWQVLFDGRNARSQSMLAFSTSGVLTIYYRDSSGASKHRSTGFSMADRTGWHHYVLTFTGPRSSGTFRVFVDGQLVYTYEDSLQLPGTSGMYIGRGIPANELWNGLIDELLILPYAVTDEEIKAWYHSNSRIHNNADAYVTL